MDTDNVNETIKMLYVLYDPACGVCCGARDWMLAQTKFIEMRLVAAGSGTARELFPELHTDAAAAQVQLEELTVVDDLGGVYRGGEAWVMCLYALTGYRNLALRLAEPELLPLARNAFSLLSRSRKTLSDLLGLTSQDALAIVIQQETEMVCVPQSDPYAPSEEHKPENPPSHALRVAHESWLW